MIKAEDGEVTFRGIKVMLRQRRLLFYVRLKRLFQRKSTKL